MKNRKMYKEDKDMAVFSKPANFSFRVTKSKADEFIKKDTRVAFNKTMEKFKRHGGKTDTVK